MKKILSTILAFLAIFGLSAGPVFAHAVVKPSTAGIGSFTDFSLGVPSEKDSGTVAVKLMLPTGLNNVSPIVKPGWKIEVKTSTVNSKPDDDGNMQPSATEIDWTGGQIPSGQKDFFQFSAQVPATAGELDWKVEQTYADGSTVSWTLGSNDPQPTDSAGKSDFSKFGPYSKTMVTNDLKPSASPEATVSHTPSSNNSTWVLAVTALALAVVSIGMQLRKKTSQ